MTKRSSTKPPPKNWVFFTDRDLGIAVPDALAASGHAVERCETHFPDPQTLDEVWLPFVAERGWIAFTHDKKILRVKVERDAAMNSGLALFALIGKMRHGDLAKNLIATIPQIIRFREKHDVPFIARVHRCEAKFVVGTRPGSVEMALTKPDFSRSSPLQTLAASRFIGSRSRAREEGDVSLEPLIFWLPKPPDNANTKLHHMVAARRKNAYLRQLDARAQARLNFPPPPAVPLERVVIDTEWHYPNRRHHLDDDNAIRRLKPVVDYLVRHGYLAGDTGEHVTWSKPTRLVGALHNPPLSSVRLTLSPVMP